MPHHTVDINLFFCAIRRGTLLFQNYPYIYLLFSSKKERCFVNYFCGEFCVCFYKIIKICSQWNSAYYWLSPSLEPVRICLVCLKSTETLFSMDVSTYINGMAQSYGTMLYAIKTQHVECLSSLLIVKQQIKVLIFENSTKWRLRQIFKQQHAIFPLRWVVY